MREMTLDPVWNWNGVVRILAQAYVQPYQWKALESILENNQNTYYPHFSLTPKTGVAFPKTDV